MVSVDGDELLVFDSRSPVSGTASVVSDREYEEVVTSVHVDEVVGKAWDPCSSQGEIGGGFGKRRAGLGPCGDHHSGSIDRRQERQAEPSALLVVPTDGMFEFSDGFWSKANAKRQSASLSVRRCRTTVQSSVGDSPESAWFARRVSSAVHSLRTVVGSSLSSRLASSRAATSARSSADSPSAVLSTVSASVLTVPRLLRLSRHSAEIAAPLEPDQGPEHPSCTSRPNQVVVAAEGGGVKVACSGMNMKGFA